MSCFAAFEFQEVRGHPSLNFLEAVVELNGWELRRGVGADVNLTVISVAVKAESMVTDDLA